MGDDKKLRKAELKAAKKRAKADAKRAKADSAGIGAAAGDDAGVAGGRAPVRGESAPTAQGGAPVRRQLTPSVGREPATPLRRLIGQGAFQLIIKIVAGLIVAYILIRMGMR